MAKHRIYAMPFARVYPEYVAKAERKGRTKAEVDQIISWLTGYDEAGLAAELDKQSEGIVANGGSRKPKSNIMSINNIMTYINDVSSNVRRSKLGSPKTTSVYSGSYLGHSAKNAAAYWRSNRLKG